MKEFKVGDKIRIIPTEIDSFLVAYQKRVKDRVAIVADVWCYLGRKEKNYSVVWQKRGNRGKEQKENIIGTSISYYEPAP